MNTEPQDNDHVEYTFESGFVLTGLYGDIKTIITRDMRYRQPIEHVATENASHKRFRMPRVSIQFA